LRFAAHNDGAAPARWLLELAEPLLEHVDLYVVHRDGRSESWRTGSALPFANRALGHANFVFPLENAPHEAAIYYLRVRGGPVLRAPLRAWSYAAYAEHHERELLLRALCLGALLTLALSQLNARVRRMQGAWRALFVLSLAGVLMSFSGQLAQFLLPDSPRAVVHLPALTVALAMVSLAFGAADQLRAHAQLARPCRAAAYAMLLLLPLAWLVHTGLVLRVELGLLLALSSLVLIRLVRPLAGRLRSQAASARVQVLPRAGE
ncbi:MAG TPA: 7TM-DISM domain-containing protein, partial [Polyangiales bacterium]|nr:7TM-DISM domain-containing protein [Polyangiales bacterium]